MVTFFFESSTIFEYSREDRMTLIQYISQVGGLMGLCIGFSFISAAELFYWFTIRYIRNLWMFLTFNFWVVYFCVDLQYDLMMICTPHSHWGYSGYRGDEMTPKNCCYPDLDYPWANQNLIKWKYSDALSLRKFKNLAKKLSDFDKNLTTKKTIFVDLLVKISSKSDNFLAKFLLWNVKG